MKFTFKTYILLAALVAFIGAVFCIAFDFHSVAQSIGTVSMAGMAPIIFTPNDKRAKLEAFKNYIQGTKGYTDTQIRNLDIKQYVVRLLFPLANNQNFYQFDMFKGYQGQEPFVSGLEKKALDKRILYPMYYRVCVQKLTSDGALGLPMSYEDSAVFAAADEQKSISSVFNGTHSFTTDSVQRLQEILNSQFRYAPQQQDEVVDTLHFIPQSGPTQYDRGFVSMDPATIIDTTKTNVFAVQLFGPTTAVAGEASADFNEGINLLAVEMDCIMWNALAEIPLLSIPNGWGNSSL